MIGAVETKPGASIKYCAYHRTTVDGCPGPPRKVNEVERMPFEVLVRSCPVHALVLDREPAIEDGGFDTPLHTIEAWDFRHRIRYSQSGGMS